MSFINILPDGTYLATIIDENGTKYTGSAATALAAEVTARSNMEASNDNYIDAVIIVDRESCHSATPIRCKRLYNVSTNINDKDTVITSNVVITIVGIASFVKGRDIDARVLIYTNVERDIEIRKYLSFVEPISRH